MCVYMYEYISLIYMYIYICVYIQRSDSSGTMTQAGGQGASTGECTHVQTCGPSSGSCIGAYM